MPSVSIQTNLSSEKVPATFLKNVADEIADQLGKPPSVMMAVLETDKNMLFGGSDEPTLLAEVDGIELSAEAAPGISNYLFGLVEEELGIPAGRVFVKFTSVERGFWAGNGKVF